MKFITLIHKRSGSREVIPDGDTLVDDALARITSSDSGVSITTRQDAVIHVGATGQRGDTAQPILAENGETRTFRAQPITEILVSHRGKSNRPTLPSIEVDCIP